MKPQESGFFGNFYNTVMHGREYVVYEIQTKKLILEKTERGHFTRTIEAENRKLLINYYMTRTGMLFVLTAHIVRKGEPRPKELEALKKYVEDLEQKNSL